MNLENSIKDVISKKFEDGTVEKLVGEQLEKGVVNALESLFRSYGDVTKVIEDKIKSVMIPYLESYDYSQYLTKLDSVLVDVLKNSALENKKLIENFSVLLSSDKVPDNINISDIYGKWCEHCKDTIDKDNIDNYDYEGGYINTSMRAEEVSSSWSDWETQIVTFECEEDEELNIEFTIERWKKYDKEYTLRWKKTSDLESLRYLDEFDMFMMRLSQAYSKIELDTESEMDEIYIEYEE